MKKIKTFKSISRQIVGRYLVIKITYNNGTSMTKRHLLR